MGFAYSRSSSGPGPSSSKRGSACCGEAILLPQTVRLHERCDTPVEYRVSPQWFVRVLDFKEQLLAAGEAIDWCPAHMKTRYQQWVEGLSWDWCISRQR